MPSNHNVAKHGSARDAATLLDTLPEEEAMNLLLAALINALGKIEWLEDRISELEAANSTTEREET